ncbi:hypothetical protein ACEQ8H_003520 [Pleosporales sp. CAS-2024a]
MLDMLLPDHDHDHDPPRHAPASPTSHGGFLAQMPLSILGAVLRRPPPTQAMGALPGPPDTPTASRPPSSASSAGDERSLGAKRPPRAKTSYVCARPVRPVDAKLHLRPKVLLQLHQLLPAQRPRPTYELIPFSLLPPKSTRRLARTFNTRDKIGPHHVLVVKADEYGAADHAHAHAHAADHHPDHDWASREVVGVISPPKPGRGTDICMDDGASRWEVTHMPNGGFEFNTTTAHGLAQKVRWVPKPAHGRRASPVSSSSHTPPALPHAAPDDRKYTFSTISPTSRRHPIIATMTRTRIDIMDSYTMPTAAAPTPAGHTTPQLTPASDMESFISADRVPIATDDALRRLILVTGSWIALQSSTTALPSRTVSLSGLDTPRSSSPTSTIDESHYSLPRLLRTSRERLPRSTSFTEPSSSPASSHGTPGASPKQKKTRPRRANSTGTPTLHSMTGSMRLRHGLAFEGETLAETEEERYKRSLEILRIKELVLPPTIERVSSEGSQLEPRTPALAVIPAPLLSPAATEAPSPLLSPPTPDPDQSQKTQSAFEPVKTAGLWDSGVAADRPGRLKSRPTSMTVLLDKQKKHHGRQSNDDANEYRPLKKHDEWTRFKATFRGIFRRERA